MPLENKKFKQKGVFCKVVRGSQKRTLRDSEFQRVGADTRKKREPHRMVVGGT